MWVRELKSTKHVHIKVYAMASPCTLYLLCKNVPQPILQNDKIESERSHDSVQDVRHPIPEKSGKKQDNNIQQKQQKEIKQ